MNPIIWFLIIGTSSMVLFLPRVISRKIGRKHVQRKPETEPFVISEYLERMEKAALDILEEQEPVGQTIILWWGLDGLRMNEDGSLEWISRKKPKPANQNVFYQPCQTISSLHSGAAQSTKATIDALMEQAAIQATNAQLQSQLQSYQVGCPGYYPPYFFGGIMTGCAHPRYLPQMQNCCCNRLIRR